VFALSGEEICPGNYFGVLLEQCAPLPFGHPTPDAELDAVVQRVGAAFRDDRTVPADDGRLALRGATDEELVGVRGTTARLRYPCDAGFRRRPLDRSLR
jgi:hypothetical protein